MHQTRKKALAAWIVIGLLWAAAPLAQAQTAAGTTITIAAEDDWAPYSSARKGQSDPVGLTPELVRAIFKLKGVEVKYLTVPFPRCLSLVKTGKAVACFDTTITDENRNEFHWHPTPLFEEGLAIFALSEVTAKGLNSRSLEGSSVGITRGYTYPTDFMQNKQIKKVEANSDDLLLKMLVARRVQYVILNTMPGMLRVNNDPAAKGRVKQVGLISSDGFWLNFSKAHPDGKRMAELFESALLEYKKSGQYDKKMSDFRKSLGVVQ